MFSRENIKAIKIYLHKYQHIFILKMHLKYAIADISILKNK